jgi:Do/DeqQ family serine protease
VFALTLALVAEAAPAARADDPFLRRTPAVRAVEKVGPSVVNVTTEQVARAPSPFAPLLGDPFFDRFFQDFFEPRVPQARQSLGSGVIIDAKGHVLTNEHVVARASRIRVTLADGREFGAVVIGADPNNDVAVLQLETSEALPWIAPGSSEDLMPGEPVIAIGNPFGLSNTVTTGVISATNRSIRTDGRVYHGFLQTDASINPGNSGGPLLNAEGELIGINTAIYGGGAQGIGFAIPIDSARRVMAELIEHGEVAPVWLGLDVQDLDAPLRQAFGLGERAAGALVSHVSPAGPGARADVRRGDVVTRVDGTPVGDARSFYEVLSRATQGQPLQLDVLRDGQARTARVVAEQIPDAAVSELMTRLLGVELEPHARGGFAVTTVRAGSGSARIGLAAGDVILRINGRPLEDDVALRRSVLDLRGRERAILVVQRGSGRYHVAIPLT